MDTRAFKYYEGLDWLEAYNNIKPKPKTYDYVMVRNKEYRLYKGGAYDYIVMNNGKSSRVVSLKYVPKGVVAYATI